MGAASALDPARDWIVPQYRELPALVRHGYPLASFFRYLKGDPAGGGPPVGVNMLPLQISLAAQLPHAVGLAWGLSHQGRDSVVMVFFGDGAASEGDTHEAMNLAGIRRAPVVFILQNNGWAISTPVSSQNAAPNYAARAAGYGFPGLLVDGNDLLAMADAARWAVARARAGEGATLIEARTYRLGPHNTADEPGRYMPEHELEERRRLEPLVRLGTYLRARGLLDEQREAALTDDSSRRSTTHSPMQTKARPPALTKSSARIYEVPSPRCPSARGGSPVAELKITNRSARRLRPRWNGTSG